MDIPEDEARERFEELKALPFVERYRMGEHDLRNVHESTRLGWRKRLAHERPEHFDHLSAKVAACFADDFTPAGRIDWIYHLLCGDPKRGATELESLNRNWGSSARREDRYALASALRELEDTRLVQGGARVWVLLVTAGTRVSRGEAAQLKRRSKSIWRSARRLAEQDPSNAGWQRQLAVAQNRIGDVLQAQGKLEAAQKRAASSESWRKGLRALSWQTAPAKFWTWLETQRTRVRKLMPNACLAMCWRRKASLRRLKRRSKSIWRSAGGWPSRTRATRAGSGSWL